MYPPLGRGSNRNGGRKRKRSTTSLPTSLRLEVKELTQESDSQCSESDENQGSLKRNFSRKEKRKATRQKQKFRKQNWHQSRGQRLIKENETGTFDKEYKKASKDIDVANGQATRKAQVGPQKKRARTRETPKNAEDENNSERKWILRGNIAELHSQNTRDIDSEFHANKVFLKREREEISRLEGKLVKCVSFKQQERQKKKLKDQLVEDGFDMELQELVDDILVQNHSKTSGTLDEMMASQSDKEEGESTASGPSDDVQSGITQKQFEGDNEYLSCSDDDTENIRSKSVKFAPSNSDRSSFLKMKRFKEEGEGSSANSTKYLPPYLRNRIKADPTVLERSMEAVKTEILRAFNRVSEGNIRYITQNLLKVLQLQLKHVKSDHDQSDSGTDMVEGFKRGIADIFATQLITSAIENKFSTASLVATQTAICCAFSRLWDLEVSARVLERLAISFKTHFTVRTWRTHCVSEEDLHNAELSAMYCRHAALAVTCLFDFGFISSLVFVQLLRRIVGLQYTHGSKATNELPEFSDARAELVLLALRHGGSKLRQQSPDLLTDVWKELHALSAGQNSSDSNAGQGIMTGRIRALMLELSDLKNKKQKDRALHMKASQNAMREWLQDPMMFGAWLAHGDVRIECQWEALERGGHVQLTGAAARTSKLLKHQSDSMFDFLFSSDAKGTAAESRRAASLAEKLRFHLQIQKDIFEQLLCAEGPDDAVILLQKISALGSLREVTQSVAVILQCALQERVFNEFYPELLIRLCGVCRCGKKINSECICSIPCDKVSTKVRRVLRRGIIAQTSVAHGFAVRRLLNLSTLLASLIRIGIVEFNTVRFINADGTLKINGPTGLSGKLGIFLTQICRELLCHPKKASIPIMIEGKWEEQSARLFSEIGKFPDLLEAFSILLRHVLLPEASKDGKKTSSVGKLDSNELNGISSRLVRSALHSLNSQRS